MGETSSYLVENIDGHYSKHGWFGFLAAFLMLLALGRRFGRPGVPRATRLVELKGAFSTFLTVIDGMRALFRGFPHSSRLPG